MQLPGGLWSEEGLRRDFAFKPLTGHIELTLAESRAASLPQRVTEVLAASLEHLGSRPPTIEKVWALVVGDRQFLMRQLAGLLGMDGLWLTGTCEGCAERFDFFVPYTSLPVKEAGEGYPFAYVETSFGKCRLRVPTGADQEEVAAVGDEARAVGLLAKRCLVSVEAERVPASSESEVGWEFTPDDLFRMERALEVVAPEVGTAVQVECPECGKHNVIHTDPYICLRWGAVDLYSEIHVLASNYHWSEIDILGMTRERRYRYLKLIDLGRGMVQ